MSDTGMSKEQRSERKPGRRRRRALRLVLIVSAIVVLASVLLRIAAPHLISSGLVRAAIGSAVSGWTGHEVTIDGPPVISFWPEPRVTLTNVSVRKGTGADAQLLAEIDELSASFGFYAALRGQPQFSEFRFVHPRIRIERNTDGKLDWSNEGRLSAAVRDAHLNAAGNQELSPDLDAAVDSVEVVDGEVTVIDKASGREFVVRDLLADIDWPRLSGGLGAKASLNAEGRPLTLLLQTKAPLVLIGGDVADVMLGLEVKGVTGRFQGTANLMQGRLGDGALEINATDFPAFASFSGFRLAGMEDWQTASLKTNLVATPAELRFEDLTFQINDGSGDGFLALTHQDQARPNVSGTLALDRLDLAGLLRALEIDVGDKAEARLPGIGDRLDFDVTLSAATATFSSFDLADLGASLIGKGDSLKFVIADADLLGGSLSARFSRSGRTIRDAAETSLSLEDVDMGRLIDGFSLSGPFPTGLGSLNLSAQLPGGSLTHGLETMSGTLTLRADDGTLRKFDAAGLRAMANDHAYFQLSAAGDSDFAFRRFDLSARFDNGSAEIDKAVMTGDTETLTLAGIAPFSRQALALKAELAPNEAVADAGEQPLTFFIGGVWSDPVISPFPTGQSPASPQGQPLAPMP